MRTIGRHLPCGLACSLAAAWLSLAAAGCTVLVDQELSGKHGAAGGGSGGAPGDTGAGASGGTGAGAAGGAGGSTGATSGTTGGTGGGQTSSSTLGAPCKKPMDCQLAHATATCPMGVCLIGKCDPGFGDCDGSALNGCEVEVTHDPKHCGKCTTVCDGDEQCDNGECK